MRFWRSICGIATYLSTPLICEGNSTAAQTQACANKAKCEVSQCCMCSSCERASSHVIALCSCSVGCTEMQQQRTAASFWGVCLHAIARAYVSSVVHLGKHNCGAAQHCCAASVLKCASVPLLLSRRYKFQHGQSCWHCYCCLCCCVCCVFDIAGAINCLNGIHAYALLCPLSTNCNHVAGRLNFQANLPCKTTNTTHTSKLQPKPQYAARTPMLLLPVRSCRFESRTPSCMLGQSYTFYQTMSPPVNLLLALVSLAPPVLVLAASSLSAP
jgi:hypothetical protein